jgi:hypothetical protein
VLDRNREMAEQIRRFRDEAAALLTMETKKN